jgi:hypothetical protein
MTTVLWQETVPPTIHNGKILSKTENYPRSQTRPPVTGEHHTTPGDRTHRDGTFYKQLHLYSHTSEQIVAAIKQYATQPPPFCINIQNDAILEYQKLRSRSEQNPDNPAVLLEYLNLFDDMFFMGGLKKLCYIEVHSVLEGRWGDCTSHQHQPHFLTFRYPYEIRIRMRNLREHPKYRDPQVRLHNYLGTLLHECIHAIFGLYVCWSHQECQSHARESQGLRGHMHAWQDIAALLEDNTAKLPFGRLFLNRVVGLRSDLLVSRAPITVDQLVKWGLDPREVYRP